MSPIGDKKARPGWRQAALVGGGCYHDIIPFLGEPDLVGEAGKFGCLFGILGHGLNDGGGEVERQTSVWIQMRL